MKSVHATLHGAQATTIGAAQFAADHAGAAATAASTGAHGIGKHQIDKLFSNAKDFRELMELWLKSKVHERIALVVDQVPIIAKAGAEDEDMPRCVSHAKDRLIDSSWPDIREEIMWTVCELLDGEPEDKGKMGRGSDCIRAFLRFHLYPYNKSIWGKLKDPVWVIFTLISLVPWAGIMPIIFFFVFITIDHGDEYQLTAFILQFKGFQFISAGVIRTVLGFFQFVACVTIPSDRMRHTCAKNGPGIAGNVEVIVGGWVLQVILIWLAFFCMRWAKDKGRRTVQTEVILQSMPEARGSHLRGLMFYDVVCFLLCMAVVAYVVLSRPPDLSYRERYGNWVSRQAIFACQVVYGYLSVPFFFLTLPLFQGILTHTVPTGYDEEGRCRTLEYPSAPPERKECEPSKERTAFSVSHEEATELKERLMGAIGRMRVSPSS